MQRLPFAGLDDRTESIISAVETVAAEPLRMCYTPSIIYTVTYFG